MNVEKNKVVSIEYTLKNRQDQILDSSRGQAPLDYLQGYQNIIPGLEDALMGKAVGDQVNAAIPPEAAYGLVDEVLIETVPMKFFPDKEAVIVGARFQVQGGAEDSRLAIVKKVEGEDVTIDMNHPLAGETLFFEVEIKGIREATPTELEHGHVHGECGCSH